MLKRRFIRIGIALAVAGAMFLTVLLSAIVSMLFAGAASKDRYDLGSLMDGLPPPITEEMVVAAIKSYETYGVPAALILAQIILESSGSYEGGMSKLAYECKNLFGIKGVGPAGYKEYVTGEQNKDGSSYTVTAKFRKYHSFEESIMDHGKLLSSGRYKVHTSKATTSDEWAKAIHAAGYATDVSYSDKLIKIMSTYNLYRFDGMTLAFLQSSIEGDGISSGTLLWPVTSYKRISSRFGPRNTGIAGASRFHQGIDISAAQGTPILAADGGTVISAGWGDGGGYTVKIDHGNGIVTAYLHIMNGGILVKNGQKVSKGQQIAKVGSTGVSSGPHLHFGVQVGGKYVDPLKYVKEP